MILPTTIHKVTCLHCGRMHPIKQEEADVIRTVHAEEIANFVDSRLISNFEIAEAIRAEFGVKERAMDDEINCGGCQNGHLPCASDSPECCKKAARERNRGYHNIHDSEIDKIKARAFAEGRVKGIEEAARRVESDTGWPNRPVTGSEVRSLLKKPEETLDEKRSESFDAFLESPELKKAIGGPDMPLLRMLDKARSERTEEIVAFLKAPPDSLTSYPSAALDVERHFLPLMKAAVKSAGGIEDIRSEAKREARKEIGDWMAAHSTHAPLLFADFCIKFLPAPIQREVTVRVFEHDDTGQIWSGMGHVPLSGAWTELKPHTFTVEEKDQ